MTGNTGRNDPCPCGSGKKFKKCCGANPAIPQRGNKTSATITRLLQSAVKAHQTGDIERAKTLYRQVLQLDPNNDNALNLLGVIARQSGDFDSAYALISRAVQIDPNAVEFHFNLAKVFEDKKELKNAVIQYQRALELQPGLVNAHICLGLLFYNNAQLAEAIAHFQYASQLQPDNADIHLKLAQAYVRLDQFQKAISHFKKSLEISPCDEARIDLGSAYYFSGDPQQAAQWYQKMLTMPLDSADAARVANSILLFMNYLPHSTPEILYNEHVNFARKFTDQLAPESPKYGNDPSPLRRLKIGYVSPDFRAHSVNFFILPVLQQHNADQVEVFCFYNNDVHDEFTEKIKPHCQHWHDIAGMDDDSVARLIREDGIDILVDLSGHTQGNRLLLFARKPAPIQVSWIGYPNTTGLSTMDYRITDKFADPEGTTDKFYTEKLVRLPDSFSCFSPPPDASEVQATPALQTGQISFGTFNNMAKISSDAVRVWSQILATVGNSRLILKNRALNDASIKSQVVNSFNLHGINADRLLFLGGEKSNEQHLLKYNMVDIALDTFPYNGTTTTCDALWMGVPVIVMEGDSHVSRVGVSQMNNIGLPELIAKSEQDYVRIATELASDLKRLQTLRSTMRDRMLASPLMDAARFTQHLEHTYRDMWRQWCQLQKESR